MSRGLGRLQILIVERMKTRAGVECDNRPYGEDIFHQAATIEGGDFVRRRPPAGHFNIGFLLAAGVHDMRRVAEEVTSLAKGLPVEEKKSGALWDRMTGRTHVARHNSIFASFSRAVRGLERRAIIEFPALVPIADYDPEVRHWVHFLADGTFIDGRRHGQRRFARLLT